MMVFNIAQVAGWLINPALAGAGAAAVAIPIAIHLLSRLRHQQVQWAAMRFLAAAFRKHKQRLRLEQWLLLLVRCLIVFLLGLALGQPLLKMLGGTGGTGGRMIHLVMDDTLSAQADEGGRSRFERLKETALLIISDMRPADRLALWRSARPVQAAIKSIAFDAATARQVLATMRPRFSQSDLTAALTEIAKSAADPQPADRNRPVVVIVLSDFSATTLDLGQRPPKAIVQLAKQAKLFVASPSQPAANVQIASLSPRRRTLVVDAVAGRAVPAQVRLARFADDQVNALTRVSVRLLDGEKVISTIKRDHRWSAGQDTATIQFDLPIDIAGILPPTTGITEKSVTMEASIQNASGTGTASVSANASRGDAIEADNHRWSVMTLRTGLTVAVVDDMADLGGDTLTGGEPGEPGLLPRDWVALALAPRTDQPDITLPATESMELIALDAAKMDSASLNTLDAAIVLRPDRLSAQGINALTTFTQRGGLVWLTAPNRKAPLTWAAPLLEQFKLDWRVALEPIEIQKPGTALVAGGKAPQVLNLLGADWESLLRPVRVHRLLDVTIAEGSDAAWLTAAGGAGGAGGPGVPGVPGAGDKPLLLAGRYGEGWVLLLTAAMDDRWTNLPTKPLFVPLLHETLRSLIGQRGEDAVLAGRRPDLGRRWANIQQLTRPRPSRVNMTLIQLQGRRTTAKALDEPGIYRALPSGAQLAVNVDAAAGDLRALDAPQVATWLGAEQLSQEHPAQAMLVEQEQTNIGWQLLWCVAGLVLLETVLARWFSHAAKMQGAAGPRAQGVL